MLEEESEVESEYAPTKCSGKDNFRKVQRAREWRWTEGRRKLWNLLAASLCEKDTMSEHTPMVTDDQDAEERAKSLSDISFPEDLLKYAQEIVENLENEADMIEEIKSAACHFGEMKIARQLQEIQLKSFMEDTLETTEGFYRMSKIFVLAVAVFGVSVVAVKAWLRRARWVDCKKPNPKHKLQARCICYHMVENVSLNYRYYESDPLAEEARQMLKEVLPRDLLARGRPLVPAMEMSMAKKRNVVRDTRYKISAGSIYPATKEEVFSWWCKKGWKVPDCEEWWRWAQPEALANSVDEEMQ